MFPHVSLFLENHVEGVTFQPHEAGHTVEVRVDAGEPAPDESHFFVAVCAHRRQIGNPTFVYVPRAANVLRERERHIALLEGELATKDEWLDKAQQDLAEFDRAVSPAEGRAGTEQPVGRRAEPGTGGAARAHRRTAGGIRARAGERAEGGGRLTAGRRRRLERSNQWAEALNRELEERRARIVELQEEFAREQENGRQVAEGYAAKVAALELDIQDKTRWAIDTETSLTAVIRDQTERLSRAVADLGTAVEALHHTEKELEERTAWALRLQDEARRLEEQVALFRASRWVKLGRTVGLGPV